MFSLSLSIYLSLYFKTRLTAKFTSWRRIKAYNLYQPLVMCEHIPPILESINNIFSKRLFLFLCTDMLLSKQEAAINNLIANLLFNSPCLGCLEDLDCQGDYKKGTNRCDTSNPDDSVCKCGDNDPCITQTASFCSGNPGSCQGQRQLIHDSIIC